MANRIAVSGGTGRPARAGSKQTFFLIDAGDSGIGRGEAPTGFYAWSPGSCWGISNFGGLAVASQALRWHRLRWPGGGITRPGFGGGAAAPASEGRWSRPCRPLLCRLGARDRQVSLFDFACVCGKSCKHRVGSALRSEITRNLLRVGLHDAAPRVLATIAVRIREIEQATSAGVLRSVHAVAQLVPLAIALIVVSPALAIGSAFVLTPFAYVLSTLRRRWRRASEHSQALVEQLHAGTDELVKNLDLWRSYGKAEHVVDWMDGAATRAAVVAARVDATRAALSGVRGSRTLACSALSRSLRRGRFSRRRSIGGFAAVFSWPIAHSGIGGTPRRITPWRDRDPCARPAA